MDRVSGAIMGALIGDALGLGCHWYYDLDAMRQDYGPWVNGYTTPKSDRYHGGMRAGQSSQSGFILTLLLCSVAEWGEYRQDDFTRRMDEQLFPLLNGTPVYGPGGYTSQSIREAYRRRIEQGRDWQETGGHADTSEAAERAIVLAAHYAHDPGKVAEVVSGHCLLTQGDEAIIAMSTAYNIVLSCLITGEKFTSTLSDRLMQLVHSGQLPFHAVTGQNLASPRPGDPDPPRAGRFSSPDALLTPGYMARAATDPDIRIEPAWKVSIVYGMPCAIYHQLPAAYYLAARFHDNFEAAVLHAINGGGQNMSRAMLTGALVGAQVGLEGIPERFLVGLENSDELLALCRKIGERE